MSQSGFYGNPVMNMYGMNPAFNVYETTNAIPSGKGKGKEGQVEPDGLGNENEWQRMQLEMVECNVPLKVWPGNTAFRPHEVIFRL